VLPVRTRRTIGAPGPKERRAVYIKVVRTIKTCSVAHMHAGRRLPAVSSGIVCETAPGAFRAPEPDLAQGWRVRERRGNLRARSCRKSTVIRAVDEVAA